MATVRPPRSEGEKRIMQAINRRVRSGQPFTTDSIWPRLKDLRPGDYRSWLGGQMSRMAAAKAVTFVGWEETDMSGPKSRAARVWQGTKEAA